MARPKLQIDPTQVYKLAANGFKMTHVAEFFDCSVDTIERRFADDYRKGKANLRMRIGVKQVQLLENNNVTMAIWLGKQHLGQVDKIDHEHSGKEDGSPIVVKHTAINYDNLTNEQLHQLNEIFEASQKPKG